MTRNLRIGLVLMAGLILIWVLSTQTRIKANNQALQSKVISLQKQAIHFSQLKKRWGKKGELQRLLRRLEMIKTFDKKFTKAGNSVIVYKKLDQTMLNKLSYAIFASDVALVAVEMKKSALGVTLNVEMKP